MATTTNHGAAILTPFRLSRAPRIISAGTSSSEAVKVTETLLAVIAQSRVQPEAGGHVPPDMSGPELVVGGVLAETLLREDVVQLGWGVQELQAASTETEMVQDASPRSCLHEELTRRHRQWNGALRIQSRRPQTPFRRLGETPLFLQECWGGGWIPRFLVLFPRFPISSPTCTRGKTGGFLYVWSCIS